MRCAVHEPAPVSGCLGCAVIRAERAEAECARLRAALQRISDMYPDGPCACAMAEEALAAKGDE